jgi:SAM-dependent methyltransferase
MSSFSLAAVGSARPGDAWRRIVAERQVPEEIRSRAPEGEWSLEPDRFRWRPEAEAQRTDRPSYRRAAEALPEGGSVLDIGAGGGGSSLGLAPKAGLITGVDRLEGMLASFAESAAAMGVEARTVLGTWPEVAPEVEPADVVVSHHAVYGITEIEAFLTAMADHARRRAVLEVSAHFPQSRLLPLWERFHGVGRPDPPVADVMESVLRAMGFAVAREDAVVPARMADVNPKSVAFARRRLYVGPERDAEIGAFLTSLQPELHEVTAFWWPA